MPDGTFASGVPMGFVIDMAPDARFYHYGDTALFSDLKLIGELYQPTIGCFGIANPLEILNRVKMPGRMMTSEMNPREGAMAAQWIGVATALPCHYINPDCAEVREFNAHLESAASEGKMVPESVVLSPGDWLEL